MGNNSNDIVVRKLLILFYIYLSTFRNQLYLINVINCFKIMIDIRYIQPCTQTKVNSELKFTRILRVF